MEESYHFNDPLPMTYYLLGLLLEAVEAADDATVEMEKALDMCTTSERITRMEEAVQRMKTQDTQNGDFHRRFEMMLHAARAREPESSAGTAAVFSIRSVVSLSLFIPVLL